MANAAVGTVVQAAPATATTQTFTVSPVTVGDLMVFFESTPSSTIKVSTVSGGGADGTGWQQITTGSLNGSEIVQMFWARVGTTGSQTVTVTFSADATGLFPQYDVQMFTAGLGSATTWTVDNSGTTSGTSASPSFPTLSATGTGELYVGYVAVQNAASAGSTTGGWVWQTDSYADELVYNLSVGSGSVTPPAASQTSGTWESIAALFVAGSGTVAKSGPDTGTGTNTGSVSAPTTGTDTGTGADSGAISIPVTGADTGTGTESYMISIPVAGSDTGTGADGGSLMGSVTGADARSSADSASMASALSAADTGVAAEADVIGVTGADSGVGVDSGLVNATLTLADSGVGADGGSYQTLYGDIILSLWAVSPTTGALSPLPDFQSMTLSPLLNAPGALSVVYPSNGVNFSLLYNNVTNDRDVEVEIWVTGNNTKRLRGYLQESSGDDVAEVRIWTFSGSFLEIRMSEAVIYPQATPSANANTNQELIFSAATAGTIMSTLLSQAQARGTLTDITTDFTGTTDSNGVAWPTNVTTKFSPGATYQATLDTLVGLGLCEWSISADHVLHMYGPNGRGADLTTGAHPVILRNGRNLTSAPRKHSVRQSATAILVAGANGLYQNTTNANAQSRRGRRIEASASANNLTDSGSLTSYATQELQVLNPGLMQLTAGLGFLAGEPRPVTVFNIGDWVYVDTLGSLVRYRVAQWSLTIDTPAYTPTGTVVLNDTVTDNLAALAKRLSAVTSGSAVVGTTTGSDTSIPNAPTGLTASSTAYLDGSQVKASVQVGWSAPTANTNGTTCNDLAGFNVQYSFASSPTTWVAGATITSGSTTSATFVTTAGTGINIRVDAYDTTGNTSAWSTTLTHTTSAYTTAPPAPSTPTVTNYLGVLKIAWDGNTSTGASMLSAAPSFDHIAVHISAASGFTPSTTTYFDTLFAAGTQVYTGGTYGTTYYAKLIAIDKSGNSSVASAQGSASPSQILSADLFVNCVGTAQLQDASIVNAKIANLAVNDAQIGNLAVGKLTAGILSVSVTLSGIIRTATSGARTEIDAAGIRLYNSGGGNTVNLNANDGSAVVTGEFSSAMSGQRLVINPGNSSPDHMYIYPSGSGDYANIFTRDAVDGSAAILIDGGAQANVGRGRLGAYKQQAFISYVVNDSSGGTQTGYSDSAVVAQNNGYVSMWASTAINFDLYLTGNPQNMGHMQMQWKPGGQGSYNPMLATGGAAGQPNAGIKFDTSIVCATYADGAAFCAMKATAFTVSSGSNTKTNIADISTVLTPLAAIRTAKSKAWKYLDDVDRNGAAARTRFGPMADDLHPALVVMSPAAADGTLERSVSLGDQIGILWAAVSDLADAVDALGGKLPKA